MDCIIGKMDSFSYEIVISVNDKILFMLNEKVKMNNLYNFWIYIYYKFSFMKFLKDLCLFDLFVFF